MATTSSEITDIIKARLLFVDDDQSFLAVPSSVSQLNIVRARSPYTYAAIGDVSVAAVVE